MGNEIDPELSIVMPVYNEEECIGEVIEQVQSAILAKLPGSELLAVDDGSTDATPEIIDRLAEASPQLVSLHKENGGHGDALLFGLRHARGKYLFLMDSDGQTVPEDFWHLWDKRSGSQFVVGVRQDRNDPAHRLVIARLLRYGIRLLFGVKCRDANVPFKLMSAGFWRRVNGLIPRDTLAPSIFLSVAAAGCLDDVVEVNIRHLPRTTGTCTIRYFKLFRFCVHALGQFLKFRLVAWPHIRREEA
jgi:glycosyltransferase involved in cell wall biosynthesis